ncbi:hypothetical protein [Prevotella pallens]
MAKTSSNVMISDFKEWLKGNGNLTPDSANSYIKYLGESHNRLLGLVPKNKVYNYMDVIDQFYQVGDILYAVTVINNIIERINNRIGSILPPSQKDLRNQCSALKKLRVFLHSKKNNVVDRTYLSKKNTNNPTSSTLDNIRDSFSKGSLDKIDGVRVLIEILGEAEFIKLVIENSYFFDKKIVDDQRNDILKKLGKQPIPARKTTKKQSGIHGVGINTKIANHDMYQINGCNIPVELDGDGNEQVRKLINKKTGYRISGGVESQFKNYNISHIWGKAYDPRYFTNFWNIVIVPVWANSLLDKESTDKDSIEYKLKETFKKICVKLYGLKAKDPKPTFQQEWADMASRMGGTSANEDFPPKTSKHPTYQISVIHEKKNGAGRSYGSHQVGRIILQNI